MEPSIMTRSGDYFNFLEPEKNTIKIFDIAHALSNICRFGGHCSKFYSVAQHAVLVSHLVPPHLAWQALHHDDAEAYMGDIPTPLKQLLSNFKQIEESIEHVIWKHYKVPLILDPIVKVADLQALMLERNALLPPDKDGEEWGGFRGIPIPIWEDIVPLKPNEARDLFIDRYSFLVGAA